MIHLTKLLAFIILTIPSLAVVRISVPHDIQPGYPIKKIQSKGHLHILDNKIASYFTVLNDGSLIATSKLDKFGDGPINILIKEELENRTQVQQITIHIKDRNKLLSFFKHKYHGYIFENEAPGSVVANLGNLQVKNAIGNLNYSLAGSRDFSVVEKGGVILILSVRHIDRELKSKYSLVLNATDSKGDIASTNIFIYVKDVNDNPSVLKQKHYFFKVPANSPIYSKIGVIKDIDAGGDKPIYSFVNNKKKEFVIVPKSGEVILMGTPEVGVYNMQVQVHNNRIPTLYNDIIPVTISVHSVTPREDYDEINFHQRQKRSIRQTRTYDGFSEFDGNMTGKVMFRLESVQPDEIFTLENQSRWIDVDTNGNVKVKEPWDYEQLEQEKTIDFWVQIEAPQLTEPDHQRIIIHVQDSNDENPYFINRPLPMQAVVKINAPPGTSIFQLQARDPDENSDIHYFLYRDRTGGRFEVDEMSGEVRTIGWNPFTLDKEYVVYVVAEDFNSRKETGVDQFTDEEKLSIVGVL